jgi:hypothetical protein
VPLPPERAPERPVKPHLRRLPPGTYPSTEALRYALVHGIHMPTGYTIVSAHLRSARRA